MPDKPVKKPGISFEIDPNAFSAALFLAARGEYEAAGRVLAEIVDNILKPYKHKVLGGGD